jgi:hypothetical protein
MKEMCDLLLKQARLEYTLLTLCTLSLYKLSPLAGSFSSLLLSPPSQSFFLSLFGAPQLCFTINNFQAETTQKMHKNYESAA